MTSNAYFSTPISTWTAPHLGLQRSRKRKRQEVKGKSKDDDPSIPAQEVDVPSSSARRASSSQPRPIYTPNDIAQFRVAGHEVNQAVPRPPFPHRQPRGSETINRELQDEDLQFEHSSQADEEDPKLRRQRTLRQQHMGALVTQLHRCVMQKDYARARRAFGLLLRHEVGGHSFDVRTGATWGIGAEILMHLNGERSQLRPLPTILATEHSTANEPFRQSWDWRPSGPTRHTFDLTKRYFESLSVQYAYNTSRPRMFSAVDFKLAMFEFWIYTLQEELKTADIDGSRSPSGENSDTFVQDPMPDFFLPTDKATIDLLESIITEANDIQGQLENLMQAPIYSNRPDYLNLYEGVKRWIGDLRSKTSSRPLPSA